MKNKLFDFNYVEVLLIGVRKIIQLIIKKNVIVYHTRFCLFRGLILFYEILPNKNHGSYKFTSEYVAVSDSES
jgi:hypothetical protein